MRDKTVNDLLGNIRSDPFNIDLLKSTFKHENDYSDIV